MMGKQHKNGTLIYEYHVNCYPEFFETYITLDDCIDFGGNLSMCIPDGAHLKLLIGHECIIKK